MMSEILIPLSLQAPLPCELEASILALYQQATLFNKAVMEQHAYADAGGDPTKADIHSYLDVLYDTDSPFLEFITAPDDAGDDDLYKPTAIGLHRAIFEKFCDVAFTLFEFLTGRNVRDAGIIFEPGWDVDPSLKTNPTFTVEVWKALSFYLIMVPINESRDIPTLRFKALLMVAGMIRDLVVVMNGRERLFDKIAEYRPGHGTTCPQCGSIIPIGIAN